jgi:hypothetical protein
VFLCPATVLASGGDVLILLWLEVLLFVVALILSAAVRKLSWTTRTLLFLAYIAAVFATSWATADMPYSANQVLIISVAFGIPAAVLFGGFAVALRLARNRETSAAREQ